MDLDPVDVENLRVEKILRFTKQLAIICVVLAALPALIGWASAPNGALYFGIQTNLDDHMVYAAWMRQAMEGRFLFDNRFAVDPQPGLTVHLYFFVLGMLAKVTGIPIAMFIARLALTFLFVTVLGRFLVKLRVDVFVAKYVLLITCFGGGIGFLVWEKFGQEFVNGPELLKPLFLGLAPIDVWQPEAFVFPSMLTNGLFMVSLCLIIWILRAVVEARESWKPVLTGAVCSAVLMNIHSYDMLLVAVILVGYLVTQAVQKRVTGSWVLRSLAIGAGAVPSALWFVYVLAQDPVFQARAATPTYSPNFRQVFFGLLPAVVLALIALWKQPTKNRLLGFGAVFLFLGSLFVLSEGHNPSQYFVQGAGWVLLLVTALVVIAVVTRDDDAWNLGWAWALAGIAAIYFPALFQRKLAMALIVPWSLVAAFGLYAILKGLERSTRNLVATLSLCIVGGSSLAWFLREIYFIRADVGRTAVHSVYFSRDVSRIIQILGRDSSRKVVLAMPGIWNPVGPADFRTPLVTDLNPVLTGMSGAYSYAGHWSETPDYNRRRALAMSVFLATTPKEKRDAILQEINPDYLVVPNPDAFPEVKLGDETIPLADLRYLGEAEYQGNQLLLIKVGR